MPTELPHAAEIRILRAQAERGLRARATVPDLEGALTSLALGGDSAGADRVQDRLAEEWPDLEIDGELYARLTKARSLLHSAIAEGERAGRQMNDLLHAQGHALRSPEYEAIRLELNELSEQRTALSSSLAPVATMYASLDPLVPTLREQLQNLADEATDTPNRAVARLIGLVGSLEPVLARAPIDIELPEVGPHRAVEEQLDALRTFTDRLEAATNDLHERQETLQAELAAIDNRIRARTG